MPDWVLAAPGSGQVAMRQWPFSSEWCGYQEVTGAVNPIYAV